ncbi:hypothetical protein BH11MYX3_BH11MYX3_05290 [soil metagenome]
MRTQGLFCVVLAMFAFACGPSGRDPGGGGGGDGDGGVGVDADPGGGGGGGGGGGPEVTYVYAHTASDLYKVDPDTLAITKVGTFAWSNGTDSMTDIAIDKTGLMLGVSFSAVYRIDPTNAVATRLSTGLSGTFNGLSFVPAAMLGTTGDDVLVGTRNADGVVFRIDPMTGQATTIGNMGGFSSSGDLVAVTNFGTVQTADNGISNDRLVRLAPQTFAATAVGTDIGYSDIWGVAFWKDKIFGFTASGQFVTIDPTTGAGTLVQSNGPAWWGAAVTTSAPVIF